VPTLAEALAAIPARRDALNAIDNRLCEIIRHIERVLHEGLKVAVPSGITYATEDGHFVLRYGKWNGKWQILFGSEAEDDETKDTALISAARAVRAAVFMPVGDTGASPMEQLLIEVAESLTVYADERSPQLVAAEKLVCVLEDAGFRLVT
jgi:hypothetical protein